MPHFELLKTSKKTNARLGRIHTAHGTIETPVFMPVGTAATVKSMTPDMLIAIGAEIILSNTYHLALRPGTDFIKRAGGLHKFMNWQKPILTDSGGYQVFSLSKIRNITPDGVTFASHITGDKLKFTPQNVIDHQRNLGSDIMMPLDICTEAPAEKKQVAADLKITHNWETQAYNYWQESPNNQSLYAIIQGGLHEDLREESAKTLTNLDFPGFAIGGLSVGESTEDLYKFTEFTANLLPEDKPRYLMGVGLPENLETCIHLGIDMFDCVAPTRLARHGQFFTREGKKTIKNAKFKEDFTPLETNCHCPTCTHYTKAYIRHLYQSGEILASILLTTHNLAHNIALAQRLREDLKKEN